jgi:hypothetical protein
MPGSHLRRVKRLERYDESPNQMKQVAFGQSPEEIRVQFFAAVDQTAERAALLVGCYRRGEPLSDPWEKTPGVNVGERKAHGLALAYLGREEEARELLGASLERHPVRTREERALEVLCRAMDAMVVQKFLALMEEQEGQ